MIVRYPPHVRQGEILYFTSVFILFLSSEHIPIFLSQARFSDLGYASEIIIQYTEEESNQKYYDLKSASPFMPARPNTVANAPLTAAALLTVLAAALVPVFFLVEELFSVFRVEVVLLPVEAPPPPEVSV